MGNGGVAPLLPHPHPPEAGGGEGEYLYTLGMQFLRQNLLYEAAFFLEAAAQRECEKARVQLVFLEFARNTRL